jgi:hypothetical protein
VLFVRKHSLAAQSTLFPFYFPRVACDASSRTNTWVLNDPNSLFFSSQRNNPRGNSKRSGGSLTPILWIYSTIYAPEKQVERVQTDGSAASDAHSMIVSLVLDSGK